MIFYSFNPFPSKPWFLRVQYKSFENTVGKGEIAHNEKCLLFQQCFLTIWKTFCHFRNCRLQTLSVWKSLKFVHTTSSNKGSTKQGIRSPCILTFDPRLTFVDTFCRCVNRPFHGAVLKCMFHALFLLLVVLRVTCFQFTCCYSLYEKVFLFL